MVAAADSVFIGQSIHPENLLLRFGNRHGLITGATGTGKTVTLQIMAEGFSKAGVPVFAADVKGDLSGIAEPGAPNDALVARAKQIGMDDYGFEAFPTIFWDLYGEQGHPVRTTMSEMGPLLLSRLMNLTEAQEGALNIAFRIADQEGMALLDMKDLRAMLTDLAGRADELRAEYGNVTASTIGAIQRRLLVLEQQGADQFFGEPALSISDLMRTTPDGRGYVSILAADKLMQAPGLYATFLLSLMSELFEQLPEVGNPDKPKLVFFFDEAHLLFDEAPPALIQKVEQVVRLIRSKGVGIYFVTQNPMDVPDTVLAQLGNRVQHALRAYTPREQKAVKAAATTFRQNPDLDTETAITQLGTGEALTSLLDDKGVPSMVQKTLIRPPSSRLGPVTPDERRKLISASPVYGIYETPVDRESAYEILTKRAQEKAQQAATAAQEVAAAKQPQSAVSSTLDTITQRIVRNVASQVGTQIGRALVRGILGSLTGRR
ncbi:helicase HerA-like C-terminal domain-containing protein [Rhodoligotrophos ferricapiens]|uniref:helicase HerA-like C-terminal domain-containing protein n=1 Tax=Rhodoligotrophos ferricapiens TaxID=3069264 RepID=UPI00315D483B